MEQYCANCRYFKLDVDVFPCADCTKYTSSGTDNYWAPDLKDITDPDERLAAILDGQMYLLFEISRLRAKLNELCEKEK